MNLFIRECKANIKTFCFWCMGIILLIVLSAGKTTSMVGQDNQNVEALLEQLPKSIQTVFGAGIIDYSTAIGVFAIVFTYVALIAAFHAASIGVLAFGKEERDKTFEFLYVKGRTRNYILGEKIASGILQILLLNLISFLVSVSSVGIIFGENIAADFLPMMTGLFFIQLLFFHAGLLFSLVFRQTKMAGNMAMGLVILTFLMSIAADFGSELKWLGFLTPFKYFDGKEILDGGLNWGYALICTGLSVLFAVGAFGLHRRRDLHC